MMKVQTAHGNTKEGRGGGEHLKLSLFSANQDVVERV